MNWPLFGSTFALIFLAELGDKTQLAVMSQSAASSSKWTIFAAGALALVASTAIGVLAGDVMRRLVPDERYIKCAGGVLFLIFGSLMLREVFFPRGRTVAAPAREVSAITGWMGRFVIQQAAIFERAAFEDYEALAARSLDPNEKAVFARLALEERWHHEAMLGALAVGAERDLPITQEMAVALPPVDDLMHDAAQASQEVEHAIEHERAMAQFYRTLAEKSTIPRLRETFAALAVAEENHAQRLISLRK
ncbi:MAG TPA: TMEM165/GDT1 family protein [Kiritimatiellia bacterium]|nr:TMEM165/GDT1 family protein [Kiritimatiellia bacterium]HRU71320.1 TMEM165/GDT1 family protein [Kiritimatiellia bacterium]